MKEKIYIRIPEPCHEDWNKMNPIEKGRHCEVCKKDVFDFTNQDDAEIIAFFNNYNGTACGRFRDEQLNRPVSSIELKPASNFLKYAAGLLLPALLAGAKTNGQKVNKQSKEFDKIIITGNNKTIGKVFTSTALTRIEQKDTKDSFTFKPIKITPVEQMLSGKIRCLSGPESFSTLNKTIKNIVFISGRVIDGDDGTPIAGATVTLGENKLSVATNADGYFIIQKSIQLEESISITSVGYQKTEMDITKKKPTKKLIDLQNIQLVKNILGLSEIKIDANNLLRLGGVSGGIMIRTTHSISDTVKNFFKPNLIKVFPNPVSTGGTVQLSFGITKPGFYQIRLLNSTGQLFYSFQKQITSKNETKQINLNEKMSAGIYFVQIIDENKKLVQSLKLIVQ